MKLKLKLLLSSILISSVPLSNYAHAEILKEQSMFIDDTKRSYLIHLPNNYNPDKKYPVLFAFHGGGGNMYHMSTNYGIVEKSNELEFIAVFPNGFSRVRNETLATWNAGKCCGLARDSKIDDVHFTKELVSKIKANYSVDSNKIYATGMSNGAMMSYRLACEISDTFKAIAAVAGTDNTEFCEPHKLPHILHIHARDDDNVLIEGGLGKNSLKKHVTDYTSLDQTINKWLRFSDLKYSQKNVLKEPLVSCDKYITQRKQHIQVCITEDGGHSWPGLKGNFRKQPSQAINANDEMWKFFNSLP